MIRQNNVERFAAMGWDKDKRQLWTSIKFAILRFLSDKNTGYLFYTF